MGIQSRNFKLFSVIGYPLAHTLSPYMHMSAIKGKKINGIYISFEIEPKKFNTVMKKLKFLPLNGFNVTVPYKEKIIPFLDTMSPEARIMGAVNTVKVGSKTKGFNTDAYGFARSLADDLKFSPRGKRILIIGAGGAARACLYALSKGGARTIVIADIIQKRARALKRHFSKNFKDVQFVVTLANEEHYKIFLSEVDMVVNATPIGLRSSDPLLIPARIFPKKKLYVYDLIYNPSQTKLIKVAKGKGCRTSNGLGMLLHQGARAFEIWTGMKAPVSDMRRALLKGIREAET